MSSESPYRCSEGRVEVPNHKGRSVVETGTLRHGPDHNFSLFARNRFVVKDDGGIFAGDQVCPCFQTKSELFALGNLRGRALAQREEPLDLPQVKVIS